jgi:isopenicillin-N N-acyltransferase-like protein
MIAELAEIRLGLVHTLGAFTSEEEILAVAAQHLPVLAEFDVHLSEELLGIAEGAGVDPARIVVLNHYTDLRDIVPAAPWAPDEEDCSAVFTQTPEGPMLGQTWDMHGSAEPFVMMMHVPAREDVPEAWVFTITGCLGMTGMNGHGLAITINNLKSLDAKVGVVWPALVRRVLTHRDAEAGRDVIMHSPLSSGHHYLIATKDAAYGIETSGHLEKVIYEGGEPSYVHTNHCLDREMAAVHRTSASSTTQIRYDWLTASITERAIESREDMWRRLGSHDGYPKSVCAHLATPSDPHAVKSCGGLVMDLTKKDLWATAGCLNHARPQPFGFHR